MRFLERLPALRASLRFALQSERICDLHLSSEIAVAVGMAVQELTTNCTKYGPFSLPTGCVEVSWTAEKHG
jgi:two-component sensor histidine kinase